MITWNHTVLAQKALGLMAFDSPLDHFHDGSISQLLVLGPNVWVGDGKGVITVWTIAQR